jgi:peroxiredoxin
LSDDQVVAAGTPAPDFTLRREDGTEFTRDDLLGKTTVLVFYPFAFSRVCTDQLNLYE